MSYYVILGGTAGLGYELYRNISANHNCIVVGRRTTRLLSKQDLFLQADFSYEVRARKLIAELTELTRDSEITGFCWVSGVLQRSPSVSIAPEAILNMVDVNLRNPLLVASWIWQHMHASRVACQFSIVSSTVAFSDAPRDDEAVYAAVKTAQVAFARALGKQNNDSRIRVSLLAPGGMQTEFWSKNPIEQNVYPSFLDPVKVAKRILDELEAQTAPYLERVIPRGSL